MGESGKPSPMSRHLTAKPLPSLCKGCRAPSRHDLSRRASELRCVLLVAGIKLATLLASGCELDRAVPPVGCRPTLGPRTPCTARATGAGRVADEAASWTGGR